MNKYGIKAQKFMKSTNTTITKEFLRYDFYFPGDKEKRNVWSITLKNNEGSYTFEYGDSIINSAKYKPSELLPKGYSKTRAERVIKAVDKYNNQFPFKKIVNIKDCNDVMLKHIFAIAGNYSQTITGSDGILKYLEPIDPEDYDILACLDLVYENTFEDWCYCFGYDSDSKTAEKIYHTCIEQDRNLRRMYDKKELEILSSIN